MERRRPERVRQRESEAMRFLNNRRANLRRAKRKLVAARAALALLAH